MMIIPLVRFCIAPDGMGTFGHITIGAKRWWTVERDWRANEKFVSCIPTGAYQLKRGTFIRGGGYPDLELQDVPGRTNIEIHAANYARQLQGCIAPGKTLSLSTWSVGSSGQALREILAAVEGEDDLVLNVQWAGGLGL